MGQFLLRPLDAAEQQVLVTKLADKSLPARKHQRYRIIAEARTGRPSPAIADRVGCHPNTVYFWIHRFNASGFATFEVATNPNGRTPVVTGEQIRALIKVALSRPEDLGLPFTHWSVAKLKAYCLAQGLLPPITDEWVRRLLRQEGVSLQRTKSWKASPDPDFEVKKTASSTSTRRRPRTGR